MRFGGIGPLLPSLTQTRPPRALFAGLGFKVIDSFGHCMLSPSGAAAAALLATPCCCPAPLLSSPVAALPSSPCLLRNLNAPDSDFVVPPQKSSKLCLRAHGPPFCLASIGGIAHSISDPLTPPPPSACSFSLHSKKLIFLVSKSKRVARSFTSVQSP